MWHQNHGVMLCHLLPDKSPFVYHQSDEDALVKTFVADSLSWWRVLDCAATFHSCMRPHRVATPSETQMTSAPSLSNQSAQRPDASRLIEGERSHSMIFFPDKKTARKHFEQLQERAAWFCVQAVDGQRTQALLGATISEDTAYDIDGERRTLRRGGALIRCEDGRIAAIQPEAFVAGYARCFSDGTEICKLQDTQMRQAVALSQSNTQIRTRIEELPKPSAWHGINRILGRKSAAQRISDWNSQLRAHIQDLTMRHNLRIG